MRSRTASCGTAVIWENGPAAGEIEVVYGKLDSISIKSGQGKVNGPSFRIRSPGECRLLLAFREAQLAEGSCATRVTVRARKNPFTFFLRDVNAEYPIFLPRYGVAVTRPEDARSYRQIAEAVSSRGLQTELDRIGAGAEESYAGAAQRTRNLKGPTWLGLGRDMRIFEFSARASEGYWGEIMPRFHGMNADIPEIKAPRYHFVLGRGAACENSCSRRLEEGCLPILHGGLRDGDIEYRFTAFVSNEDRPLAQKGVRGTHFLVADGHACGHMFTDGQKARFEELLPSELEQEETVLHLRARAINTGTVPRYAWFRRPHPGGPLMTVNAAALKQVRHEPGTGFCALAPDRIYAVCRLNGRPMADLEAAVLVRPGECAEFEFSLPHRPVPRARALKLARADFDGRLSDCRFFWKEKLKAGARVSLPEKRVDEMVRAGLLHLDLVSYGLEPGGTLAPAIGVYAPIGSESAPIILFFESMGLHDIARRSIRYFLDKQHEDGFIQNFGGYMLETGCVLYLIGEHFRFTRDLKWLRSVCSKAMKSVKYILDWRKRNLRAPLHGKGFGMLDGKVADPEDPFHYFMNSGYACLGLKRTAEWLMAINPREAGALAREAEAFRRDIRAELALSIARSPVIPIGDGTWRPTCPPWAEAAGALALFSENAPCFTHHAFPGRDSLIGPLWLVFQEVLEPGEPLVSDLLHSHHVLATLHNVGFSQPYYCRHDYAHLRRGEVNAFLKTYYNGFSGLADRETYSWWEHYFFASPHKTHEEAWFLMQTRWMLVMEEEKALRLLPGVPRAWLEQGKTVSFENMATYFGPVSLRVESGVEKGEINACYSFKEDRRPEKLILRLPHPLGLKAVRTSSGRYHGASESVEIRSPGRQGVVALNFR